MTLQPETVALETPKKKKKRDLLFYINLAISHSYMLWILVTSGAEGMLPSLGLDYGVGKSTKGISLLCSAVYAGNWEKVKANCIGAYWEIQSILDRATITQPVLGCYMDDMQATLGKDKQHDKDIKELAFYLTTVRVYVPIWIGSAPDIGMLQKNFREMFHFEVICSQRGVYEVQQLKKFVNYRRPHQPTQIFRYKGQGIFLKFPPHMQKWYDQWRDQKNRMIRQRLGAFKGSVRPLAIDDLTDPQRELVDHITKEGFVRYETLHDKGKSHIALRLKRRGWLELDKGKRFQLTERAEDVMF